MVGGRELTGKAGTRGVAPLALQLSGSSPPLIMSFSECVAVPLPSDAEPGDVAQSTQRSPEL